MRENSEQIEVEEIILNEAETSPTKEYGVADFLTDFKRFYQLLKDEDFKQVQSFEHQIITYLESQERNKNGVSIYSPKHSVEVIFRQVLTGIGEIVKKYQNEELTQLWHGLARIGNKITYIDINKLKGEFGLRILKEWLLFGDFSNRLYADFDIIRSLGEGGFGQVVCAQNKLDGMKYALKIIKTSDKKLVNHVSEIHILSELNHPNVIHYKTAWVERPGSSSSDQSRSSADKLDNCTNYSKSNKSYVPKEPSLDNLSEVSGCSNFTFDSTDYSVHDISKKSVTPNYAIARIQNNLSKNSIQTDDAPSVDVTLYIQMEKCDMTLKGWLDSKRNLLSGTCNDNPFQDWDKLNSIDVLLGISKALEYIHSKNIVHHDVTPANIFINYKWGVPRIILADFGLACSDKRKVDCIRKGTPTYSIPKYFESICHPKNDLYSLGIIAYEVALECKTQYEVIQKIKGLKTYAIKNEDEAIDPKLWAIIEKLTSEDVESRPTATELLLEIEKIYIESLEHALEGKNFVLKALRTKETGMTLMKKMVEKNEQLMNQLRQKNQQLMEKDRQLMEKDQQLMDKDQQLSEKDDLIQKLYEAISQHLQITQEK